MNSIKRHPILTLAITVAGLALILFALVTAYSIHDRQVDYVVDKKSVIVPSFNHQEIDFQPSYDSTKTLPFTASAIIDVDGDGVEEVFIGGGLDQNDALFQFNGQTFTDITQRTGFNKKLPDDSYGAVALDLDHDGDTDLLVSRQSGVWLYTNTDAQLIGEKLDLSLASNTIPLSIAPADLNKDGLFDLYISGYIAREYVEGETIFNEKYGGTSALFLNQGNGRFANITESSGLQFQHNTFQAMFVDVDNDSKEDLVVAHDTGKVRTWKNLGNLQFQNMENPSSNFFSYPMGIAITDLKNDGLPDFFFSNVGSTTPAAIVRGDLRDDQTLHQKWMLFSNQGGFKFEDTAHASKLADYEFSWGAVFEDFNLDGRDDLAVSENYVSFPTHKLKMWRLPGRFLLQNKAGEFAESSDQSGVANPYYGVSPLTADFNQDGLPDLIHINIKGPQQVFLSNKGDSEMNFLKVKLPNTVRSIGAKVSVTLANGDTLKQSFVVGEGLCSDQSHILIFGLGTNKATSVSVLYLDGRRAEASGEFLNQLVTPQEKN